MVEPAELLVGVNASEHSDEALRQGAAWANAHDWALVVAHVAPSPLGSHMLFPQLIQREASAAPQVERRLEHALRDHAAALTRREPETLETVVATGAPDAELVRLAEERAVRLVALGSHSHAGLQQIFLGDVASSVVRHARGPVLVARPHEPTRRILVATDLSHDGSDAIAAAAEHAALTGARLIVACNIERQMKVVRELTNLGSAYGFVQGEYEEACRTAEARMAAQMSAVGARGQSLVLEGQPAAAIVQAASDSGADLVVLSGANISSWMPALRGDVVVRVVRAAPCSVLVWRARARS